MCILYLERKFILRGCRMNPGNPDDPLSAIFWARSVALVGASTNPAKLGHIILRNILEGGYGGTVYPVNPSAGQVLGLPAYPDLSSLPGEVDLVIFCVPGPMIPAQMEQAARKGVRGAIIISGGFREVGNTALEQELSAAARQHGIRLVGPNCQGINFTPNKLCASWPLITQPGSIGVISQSGTVAAAMAGWLEEELFGFSGVISLGNQVDLCETDFLCTLRDDPQTKVIAMYIEGVKNGRRFMQEVRRTDKPVIVLKSGRTPGGAKAAASHTRSLAGSDAVFNGICQQLGIIRAFSVEELYDFSKGFNSLPLPKGNRLMIITSSGGSGILAVDVAEENGLRVASLTEDARQTLSTAKLPSARVINNPLDLTGDAAAENYLEALNVIEAHDLADLYLLIFGDPIAGALQAVQAFSAHSGKPVGVCYLGGGKTQAEEIQRFNTSHYPVYPSPERATRLLAALFSKSNL